MENISQLIAKDLLKIQAVFFRPEEPFTWASGIKSPVYCDNRLTITGHILGLPMGYVRSGSKDHGRQNQIEGRLEPGQKVVVVEDLISTAGSVLEVVGVLREAGAEVLGIASIFTYGMKKGLQRLAEAHVRNISLTDFDTIARAAAEERYIKSEDIARLIAFRDNPSDESWIGRKG